MPGRVVAPLLVVTQAGVEGSMGEVIEVPGVREEDLRRAAMAKANERYNRPADLQPHEFTMGDWIAFVLQTEGRQLNDTSAQRALDSLVADGILGKRPKDKKRYDPRSPRAAYAYWYLEDEDGTGQGSGDRSGNDPGRGPP